MSKQIDFIHAFTAQKHPRNVRDKPVLSNPAIKFDENFKLGSHMKAKRIENLCQIRTTHT